MPPKVHDQADIMMDNTNVGLFAEEDGRSARECFIRTTSSRRSADTYVHKDVVLIAFIGELVFGVARIFASFNDTFVHVTDLR